MFGAFNIGITGVKAAQIGMDVTSHNVANVHTDGYKRQVVEFQESSRPTNTVSEFGGQGVYVGDITNATNPFLDKIINDYATKVSKNGEALDALSGLNDILKRNDIVGSSMDVLNAFQDVSNDPTSIPIRENLMQKLTSFKDVSKGLDSTLGDYNTYLQDKAEATIDETNNLLQSIADVGSLSLNVGDATALDSKRNSLLTQLANKIEYTVAANGDLIGENGRPLLTGGKPNFLTYADIPNMQEGLIGGLNLVSGLVNDIKTQMPTSINFFTNEINTKHKQGFDINGTAGLDVFKSFTNIADLELNITSPEQIAASVSPDTKIINGTNTQNISDLRFSMFDNQSVFEKLNELQRKVAGLQNEYENTADAANTLYDQLRNSDLSNVNLDEEASNLMKYQKMYEANSKVLQTANQMLGTILDIIA
jgi:flagellar hook-associated protein 1 FlgK